MKVPVHDLKNKKVSDLELPRQAQEEYRPDLINRAVNAVRLNMRQSYGASPLAGLRHSSKLSKRRRKYRGSYGFGISRVNRKILSRRGTRFNWVGAFSPQTRGGRRAHAPKSDKILSVKINKKENRLAIRSAISATFNVDVVKNRGHQLPSTYPVAVVSDLENITKTKEVRQTLVELGFANELARSEIKKIRAGVGKTRGRPYQKKKGLLLVVSKSSPVMKSARNIAGIDVVEIDALNANVLAPGAMPGRITLFTDSAIKRLAEEELYC